MVHPELDRPLSVDAGASELCVYESRVRLGYLAAAQWARGAHLGAGEFFFERLRPLADGEREAVDEGLDFACGPGPRGDDRGRDVGGTGGPEVEGGGFALQCEANHHENNKEYYAIGLQRSTFCSFLCRQQK